MARSLHAIKEDAIPLVFVVDMDAVGCESVESQFRIEHTVRQNIVTNFGGSPGAPIVILFDRSDAPEHADPHDMDPPANTHMDLSEEVAGDQRSSRRVMHIPVMRQVGQKRPVTYSRSFGFLPRLTQGNYSTRELGEEYALDALATVRLAQYVKMHPAVALDDSAVYTMQRYFLEYRKSLLRVANINTGRNTSSKTLHDAVYTLTPLRPHTDGAFSLLFAWLLLFSNIYIMTCKAVTAPLRWIFGCCLDTRIRFEASDLVLFGAAQGDLHSPAHTYLGYMPGATRTLRPWERVLAVIADRVYHRALTFALPGYALMTILMRSMSLASMVRRSWDATFSLATVLYRVVANTVLHLLGATGASGADTAFSFVSIVFLVLLYAAGGTLMQRVAHKTMAGPDIRSWVAILVYTWPLALTLYEGAHFLLVLAAMFRLLSSPHSTPTARVQQLGSTATGNLF